MNEEMRKYIGKAIAGKFKLIKQVDEKENSKT
jgi:hypothetical protein